MHIWAVYEYQGMWVGAIGLLTPPTVSTGFIKIMQASFPYELAVDALLDFMDRLRTGRVPLGLEEPAELMELCVTAARRQR